MLLVVVPLDHQWMFNDLTTFDNIFPDDGLLKPKRYNVNLLSY